MKKKFISDITFWLKLAIEIDASVKMSIKSKGIAPIDYSDVTIKIIDVKSGRNYEFLRIIYQLDNGEDKFINIDTVEEDLSVEIRFTKSGFVLVINEILTLDASDMNKRERDKMNEILSPQKYNVRRKTETQ